MTADGMVAAGRPDGGPDVARSGVGGVVVDRSVPCARCGAPFGCGAGRPADDPCWCGTVTLTGTVTERLARTWDGCLCPTCLEAEATAG